MAKRKQWSATRLVESFSLWPSASLEVKTKSRNPTNETSVNLLTQYIQRYQKVWGYGALRMTVVVNIYCTLRCSASLCWTIGTSIQYDRWGEGKLKFSNYLCRGTRSIQCICFAAYNTCFKYEPWYLITWIPHSRNLIKFIEYKLRLFSKLVDFLSLVFFYNVIYFF